MSMSNTPAIATKFGKGLYSVESPQGNIMVANAGPGQWTARLNSRILGVGHTLKATLIEVQNSIDHMESN